MLGLGLPEWRGMGFEWHFPKRGPRAVVVAKVLLKKSRGSVVAGRVFAHHLALEPGQGLKQQGYPDAARRPLHQSQFVGAGRPTVVGGQL